MIASTSSVHVDVFVDVCSVIDLNGDIAKIASLL